MYIQPMRMLQSMQRLEMHGSWFDSKNIKLTKNSKLQNDRYGVVMPFLVIKLKNKQNNTCNL